MEGFPGSGDFDRFHPEPGNIFIKSVVPAFHPVVTVRAFRWDSFPKVKADLLREATFLDSPAACLHFDDHAAPRWPVCFHAERAHQGVSPSVPVFPSIDLLLSANGGDSC